MVWWLWSGTNGTESLAIALSQEINDVAFAYRVGTNNNLNIQKNGEKSLIPNSDQLSKVEITQ